MDFLGITPVSDGGCSRSPLPGKLRVPGEAESGSAGTQPDKEYPGRRCIWSLATTVARDRFASRHRTPELCLKKSANIPDHACRFPKKRANFTHSKTGRAKYLKAAKEQDLTGDALYQYALALAYNGKVLQAYGLLRAKLFTATPTYYYDQARICAAAAESFPKRTLQEQRELVNQLPPLPFGFFRTQANSPPARLLQQASFALDQAKSLGFTDFEKARNIRDLQILLGADANTLAPYRTFEQIAGGP
jgi:hypothetical protein